MQPEFLVVKHQAHLGIIEISARYRWLKRGRKAQKTQNSVAHTHCNQVFYLINTFSYVNFAK